MTAAGDMAAQRINSFVVLDLETTGLPAFEHNKTKITELSMVAASRESILDTVAGEPRVMHKLTLCLNPFRMISPTATKITGLSNEMLENEKTFDEDACDMICLFLSRQIPPVCLIAHNGARFDFPIVQTEIKSANKVLPDDVLCVDSLTAFQNLFSKIPLEMLPTYTQKRRNVSALSQNCTPSQSLNATSNSDMAEDRSFMQQINEKTPERNTGSNVSSPDILNTIKAKRQLFVEERDFNSQLQSFKLQDIYRFLTGKNVKDGHRAENDALTLITCITIMGSEFTEWADLHAVPFNTVRTIRGSSN